MTVLLTVEDLLALVEDLGVGPVRDMGLLGSAAHRPGAVLYGREAYPTLDVKAAALLESLVGNHALVDGNKRLGWLSVVVLYGLNGVPLDAPDEAAYQLVMRVARSEPGLEEVAARQACWQVKYSREWCCHRPTDRRSRRRCRRATRLLPRVAFVTLGRSQSGSRQPLTPSLGRGRRTLEL